MLDETVKQKENNHLGTIQVIKVKCLSPFSKMWHFYSSTDELRNLKGQPDQCKMQGIFRRCPKKFKLKLNFNVNIDG